MCVCVCVCMCVCVCVYVCAHTCVVSLRVHDMPSDDDDSYETDYSIGDISLISGIESAGSVYGDDNIEEFEEIDNIFELGDEERRIVAMETTSEQQVENLERRTQDSELQESTNFKSQTTLTSAVEHTNQETSELNNETSATPKDSFGYVLVIDNIDINVRRSYQRIDRSTESFHFCHAYAVLNRINTTVLSDAPSSGELSVDFILPGQDDLKKITDDFTVLVSRYACT